MRRWHPALAVLSGIFLLGAILIWFRSPRSQPNLVLVTVDTLRADALGCYGNRTARTPNFDRMAREGLVFDNAACAMPLTRPSHFSIMTSQYPREHGVMNNAMSLPEGVATLPEVLHGAGYQTGGFVSSKLLGPSSGAAQGFDRFVAPVTEQTWPVSRAGGEALAWVEAQRPGRPFFLWVHLFDPHMPYAPPPPFRPTEDGEALPEISWPKLLELARKTDGRLPASALDRAHRLYAGEVEAVDQFLGLLVNAIEERAPATVLAVTADHGECFENGVFFEHADCLFDGAIKVPLLIRYPPLIPGGVRRSEQVDLLRLAPTLLELAGLLGKAGFVRPSLLRDTGGQPALFESPLLSQGAIENRSLRAAQIRAIGGQAVRALAPDVRQAGVRWQSWKYVATGSHEELYDLGNDPGETHNLAAARPETAAVLKTELRSWAAAYPLRQTGVADANADLQETLRALGYVR